MPNARFKVLFSTHRQTHTHTRTHTQAHKASGTRRGCNLTPRSMQQKILNAFHALRLTLSLSQLLLSLSLPQSLLQSALLLCFPSLSHPLSVYPHTQRSAACLRVSSSDVTAAVAVSVDMGVALTATTPTNLLANLGITHTRTHTPTQSNTLMLLLLLHTTHFKNLQLCKFQLNNRLFCCLRSCLCICWLPLCLCWLSAGCCTLPFVQQFYQPTFTLIPNMQMSCQRSGEPTPGVIYSIG